jgi:stage III sporulation protein SpoIIIAA
MLIAEDFENLLKVLPQFVQTSLKEDPGINSLVEVVLDLGRMPEARFLQRPIFLSHHLIVWKDIDFLTKRVGKFSADNRAGIERTLHRISSIRNRENVIIGLTCRVGRAVLGVISIIRDLIEEEESILILGRPGVGKTTSIREISRILSDEMGKRVIIIDTSNEIAGDGDIPHPAIGSARRMQVSHPELQHHVMIEAVENHMPQVIIIDEISTELETLAARTIAERGVKLIGTAHGNSLESLIKNPALSDLIGGIQYVTLGDEEARTRGSQKSVLERKARPAFKICLEISDPDTWVVHPNIEQSVDQILQTYRLENQIRVYCGNKFRQVVECKFSTFSILHMFEHIFLSKIIVRPNKLAFNRNTWVFDWS